HADFYRWVSYGRLGMYLCSDAHCLAVPVATELRRPQHGSTTIACTAGSEIMSARSKLLIAGLSFVTALSNVRAQSDANAARHLTLPEAVQLALQHNHAVRIA